MAEYYAVERTSEYLAHYGIRGMKWGVRKAIASGNPARLTKQYMKAVKKLGKLSLNANQGVMKKRYNTAKSNMAIGAATSGGLSAALTAGTNSHLPIKKNLLYSGIAGATGAAAGALLNSKGIMSGRYASDKGHAKAIAKRNEFRKAMESEFKGTKYGGKEQHKFHQQITAISDSRDPKAYINKQYQKSIREADNIPARKTNLRQNALEASKRAENARNNLSRLGKMGYGKTAKAYKSAQAEARNATSAYYDSLSKKQYAKLRKNHRG